MSLTSSMKWFTLILGIALLIVGAFLRDSTFPLICIPLLLASQIWEYLDRNRNEQVL